METKERTGDLVRDRAELERVVEQALQKVKGSKQSDLCKYLPAEGGGYLHHFALQKMAGKNPGKLSQMLKEHVLGKEPTEIPHKPRAPRAKRSGNIALSKRELDRILEYAKQAGDSEVIAKLSPRRSLAAIKRELIASIRQNEPNEALWKDLLSSLQSA